MFRVYKQAHSEVPALFAKVPFTLVSARYLRVADMGRYTSMEGDSTHRYNASFSYKTS